MDAPKERVREWMLSKGEINPDELLVDALEDQARAGKAKIGKKPPNDG
jgi:hypothetical protein